MRFSEHNKPTESNQKNAFIVDSSTGGITIYGIAVSDLLSAYRSSQ